MSPIYSVMVHKKKIIIIVHVFICRERMRAVKKCNKMWANLHDKAVRALFYSCSCSINFKSFQNNKLYHLGKKTHKNTGAALYQKKVLGATLNQSHTHWVPGTTANPNQERATYSSFPAWKTPWTEKQATVHDIAKSGTQLSNWARF